jgi:uncharacterized protein (TIRG00374 family)
MHKNVARLILLGKLILGIALLVFLVAKADLHSVAERLYTLDLFYVLVVFVIPHLAIWLSSVKWQLLLKTLGIAVPIKRLLALYMIGQFFNNFLPTMVGGDVVKAYQLSREAGDAPSVVAATFMERFVGLAALISLLPLVFFQDLVYDAFPAFGLLVCLVILGYLASLLLIFFNVASRLPGTNSKFHHAKKLSVALQKTRTQVRFFRHCGAVLSVSYLISLLFYFLIVVGSWAAVRSTGAEVAYSYLLAVVPAVLLAALLPVSINGLGITETGYVIFLRLAGVSTVDAVTMALLLRFRVLFTAGLGGLIFILYKPSASGFSARAASTDLRDLDSEDSSQRHTNGSIDN